MSDVRARFGAALRELRARQDLTQEQLAERSGLSYKFIGEIERGAGNPTILTLERVAAALKIDMADLFEPLRRSRMPAYRISQDKMQVIRDAVATIDAIASQGQPPATYAVKRRRKRSS